MSIRLPVKYTVVARWLASRSIAVPGLTKWVTSAICTPTWKFPLSKGIQCNASSISVQPGGSTEQISNSRKSFLPIKSCKEIKYFELLLYQIVHTEILIN